MEEYISSDSTKAKLTLGGISSKLKELHVGMQQ